MTFSAASTGRTTRRRWPWVVVVVAVLVAVLVVAAEVAARAIVAEAVRSTVSSAIELPEGSDVEVATGGVLLPQLLSGRLDTVRVTSDAVALGPLTVAAEITAHGVAIRGGEMSGAEGTARAGEEELRELLAASDLPLGDVTLDDGVVTLSGSVTVFGGAIPVAVSAVLDVVAGDLLLRPETFQIGGVTVPVDAVARQLGAVGAELADPYPVCVADRMPAGVTLISVILAGGEMTAGFEIDGRIAVDPALQRPGVCP